MSEQPITPGLVRNYVLEIAEYLDGTAPTTWSKVRGIKNYTPLANTKSRQDDSDFDSGDRSTEMATTISSAISGTVKIAEAGVASVPAHAILEAAGGQTGSAGFVHYREVHTVTGVGFQGIADADFNRSGGEQGAFTDAEFSLAVRSVTPYTAAAPVTP